MAWKLFSFDDYNTNQLLHAKRVSMDIAMVETNAQMENTDGMVHIIWCHDSSYRSKKLPAYCMILCDS
jgi:hypothetical protein